MIKVPIYNSSGVAIDELIINDDVEYIPDSRVYKGKNCYYKGIGVPYFFHAILDVNNDEYENIGKHPVEGTVVLNSMSFEKSSVEILDCINYDKENDQYYYLMNYNCDRKSYLTDEEDPKKLRELLDYMIISDWNFLWDKVAIKDISNKGTVSDVADLFVSNTLSHKIGTVYSVLYSLAKKDSGKYFKFLNVNNLQHIDDRSFVFNAIEILRVNNVDVSELFKYDTINQVYKNIVINYLVTGKNCAYCACDLYKDQGEGIKDQYVELTKNQLTDIII